MRETKLYEVRDAEGFGIQPDDPWEHASKVKAHDPEQAAEKYAESYDTDGYYLSKSECNTILVEVRLFGQITPTWLFRCHASHSTDYYADEVQPADTVSP